MKSSRRDTRQIRIHQQKACVRCVMFSYISHIKIRSFYGLSKPHISYRGIVLTLDLLRITIGELGGLAPCRTRAMTNARH